MISGSAMAQRMAKTGIIIPSSIFNQFLVLIICLFYPYDRPSSGKVTGFSLFFIREYEKSESSRFLFRLCSERSC